MDDLFASASPTAPAQAPLAERMRPNALEQIIGQTQLLGPGAVLAASVAARELHSMVLWGPPGSGKTTLARLLANEAGYALIALSAVLAGLPDVRSAVQRAREHARRGQRVVLFIDEVHRFNKAQQDAFLPHVEDGTITLIGATTENPSFALNDALLSRVRVHVLEPLDVESTVQVLKRALATIEAPDALTDDALEALARHAEGDLRRALGGLEVALTAGGTRPIDDARLSHLLGAKALAFDKSGDAFYNLISALHKSVRGSDPDAALYWFARMLDGGVEPLYLGRRLIRMAVEDIGLADPRALEHAVAAVAAFERLGAPEGELHLAQLVVYLSVAPKSNAIYRAFKRARADAQTHARAPVPKHLRNAPTALMKEQGYAAGYQYDHEHADGVAVTQRYFPDALDSPRYYEPFDRGFEGRLRERLDALRAQRPAQ
jgi:putative ATPase